MSLNKIPVRTGRGKPRYHPAWRPGWQAALSRQRPIKIGWLAALLSLRRRCGLL